MTGSMWSLAIQVGPHIPCLFTHTNGASFRRPCNISHVDGEIIAICHQGSLDQLARCTSVWMQDIADAPPALAVNPTTYPLSGLEYFILNENSRYMGMSQAH